MSKLNNPLLTNKNYEDESSDDSISRINKPEQPIFYMFPESSDEDEKNSSEEKDNENKDEKKLYFPAKKKNISRKSMLTKLTLLAKYHKNSEAKLLQSRIGWHTIYEFFFEKLFFLDKNEKADGVYINLKEVEIRIRKEIGKIGKRQLHSKPQDSLFTLFDKVQYNPPVSSWYSHNFLSDNSNRLIAPKEKNSYVCQLISQFTNFENKNENNSKDKKKVDSEKNLSQLAYNIIKNSKNSSISNKDVMRLKTIDNINELLVNNNINENNNLHKNTINVFNSNCGFMDNIIKKLSTINDEENEINNNLLFNKNLNKKEIIPKGAKKVVNKFLKKHNISNYSYVEEEINNIQANEKAYEVELRNSKLFDCRFLDENRFLIDFNYLKNAINKDKKDNNFEYKKELDNLFNQIDKTIDLVGLNSNIA